MRYAILFLISTSVNAGLYLDIGIGGHAGPWHENRTTADYVGLGSDNPLGLYRFGYQYGGKIQGFAELSHMSSIQDNKDSGLNTFFIGIRISD